MTMHLCGPALTTTGKSRSKFKYASAEHKRQAEEQAAAWELLKQKHAPKKPVFSKAYSNSKMPKIVIPRSTAHIKSLNTGVGTTVKTEAPVYTGTAVVGIVIQHKSCLQPVFSQEAAMDSAKMRR